GQKPLIHERGPAEKPNLAETISARQMETAAVAPFITPEPLQNYDVILHPISGAQSMGDPISRRPEAVEDDLNKGWTSRRVAEEIHGLVVKQEGERDFTVDVAASEKRRQEIRAERIEKAVPFKDWWVQERKKVEARENMDEAVLRMWRSSMELSPSYGEELLAFWALPSDFVF
ncbi:MAG: hypothetical protein VCC04_05710, partial [Myxococcota bacterium]